MRLFAAVGLTPAQLAELRELQKLITSELPQSHSAKIRWATEAQLHLTLKFFGEVDPEKMGPLEKELAAIAAAMAPFQMQLLGVGCFPPRGAVSVVWAGVEESSGSLSRLYYALEDNLVRLEFAKEIRDFSPHITIGRVKLEKKGELRRAVGQTEFVGSKSLVDSFFLYQSKLTPTGSEYRLLKSFPFGQTDRLLSD